jgi:hypothetical protein
MIDAAEAVVYRGNASLPQALPLGNMHRVDPFGVLALGNHSYAIYHRLPRHKSVLFEHPQTTSVPFQHTRPHTANVHPWYTPSF